MVKQASAARECLWHFFPFLSACLPEQWLSYLQGNRSLFSCWCCHVFAVWRPPFWVIVLRHHITYITTFSTKMKVQHAINSSGALEDSYGQLDNCISVLSVLCAEKCARAWCLFRRHTDLFDYQLWKCHTHRSLIQGSKPLPCDEVICCKA